MIRLTLMCMQLLVRSVDVVLEAPSHKTPPNVTCAHARAGVVAIMVSFCEAPNVLRVNQPELYREFIDAYAGRQTLLPTAAASPAPALR